MSRVDAVALKQRGNEAFKTHEFDEALSIYTQAIALDSREEASVLYSNRVHTRAKHTVTASRAKMVGADAVWTCFARESGWYC